MSMPQQTQATTVSGPGALSQRTDRQPMRAVTGLPYGDGQALMQQQAGAPMAATPKADVVGFDVPTQRPDEPVTHGADAGPGADSSILSATPGPPATGGALSQLIARAAAVDTSGTLQKLLMNAQQRGL